MFLQFSTKSLSKRVKKGHFARKKGPKKALFWPFLGPFWPVLDRLGRFWVKKGRFGPPKGRFLAGLSGF